MTEKLKEYKSLKDYDKMEWVLVMKTKKHIIFEVRDEFGKLMFYHKTERKEKNNDKRRN